MKPYLCTPDGIGGENESEGNPCMLGPVTICHLDHVFVKAAEIEPITLYLALGRDHPDANDYVTLAESILTGETLLIRDETQGDMLLEHEGERDLFLWAYDLHPFSRQDPLAVCDLIVPAGAGVVQLPPGADHPAAVDRTADTRPPPAADPVDPLQPALEPVASELDDAIGCAFLVADRLSSIEIFASRDLFLKLWPSILRLALAEAHSLQRHASHPAIHPPLPEQIRARIEACEEIPLTCTEPNSRTLTAHAQNQQDAFLLTLDRGRMDMLVHEALYTRY